MPTNEVTYTHESKCEICGKTLMGSGEPTDFTMDVVAKRAAQKESGATEAELPVGWFEHECRFTEHTEYSKPVVETVEY